MRVILNADDFGLSSEVNSGVAECFKSGLCSSSTIMATGSGFDHACELAKEIGVLGRLGVHLVLSQGSPLTQGIKKFPRFCNRDGLFEPNLSAGKFGLEKDESCALASEIRAQIIKVKEAGIIPTHIDSHHHLHLRMDLVKVVAKVACEEGVRFARPMNNVCIAKLSLRAKTKIYIINLMLSYLGMSYPDYYVNLEESIEFFKSSKKLSSGTSMEINFHPSFDPQEGLVNLSFGKKDHGFKEQIKSIVANNQVISYSDLKNVSGKAGIRL